MAETDYHGVIILESLDDPDVMTGLAILQTSDIKAPPGDPFPVWSRRLVRVPAELVLPVAQRLAQTMRPDFYNHFIDEHRLVVVFKGNYFFLDKHDKSTWTEMVEYGKQVRVGPEWTLSIPVEIESLL